MGLVHHFPLLLWGSHMLLLLVACVSWCNVTSMYIILYHPLLENRHIVRGKLLFLFSCFSFAFTWLVPTNLFFIGPKSTSYYSISQYVSSLYNFKNIMMLLLEYFQIYSAILLQYLLNITNICSCAYCQHYQPIGLVHIYPGELL